MHIVYTNIMNTAVINLRVSSSLKDEISVIAEKMGLSISSLITVLLKQVARTKTVSISLNDEIPSAYTIKALKQSDVDFKAGRLSPGFTSGTDALKWIEANG